MDASNNWDNIDLLSKRSGKGCRDEVKFVISSEKDFHWAKDVVEKYNLDKEVAVLFSPVENSLAPQNLAELILHHNLLVRLQLQLHRILWPTQDRGV